MKNQINIYNYEEFFIDYLDGNLNDDDIQALEDFLLTHPELKEELEGMEKAFVHPEKLNYREKENLKQIDLTLPVNDNNFDFFCIADTEGDLNEKQKHSLNEYLNHKPEKREDYQAFVKARLNTNEINPYPHKRLVKKPVFVIYRKELFTAAAAAAGIAIFLSVFNLFLNQNPEMNTLASSEEKSVESSKTDTTSSQKPPKESLNNKAGNKEFNSKDVPEKAKKAIKKAARTITIKTSIPIASLESPLPENVDEKPIELNREDILNNVTIESGHFRNNSAISKLENDPIHIKNPYKPNSTLSRPDQDEYLSLQEFAVQKLSDLIFREDEKELNAVNLASLGIEKLNEVAGTNMKFEASAKEGSNKKVLSFHSGIISFSTPINRED